MSSSEGWTHSTSGCPSDDAELEEVPIEVGEMLDVGNESIPWNELGGSVDRRVWRKCREDGRDKVSTQLVRFM